MSEVENASAARRVTPQDILLIGASVVSFTKALGRGWTATGIWARYCGYRDSRRHRRRSSAWGQHANTFRALAAVYIIDLQLPHPQLYVQLLLAALNTSHTVCRLPTLETLLQDVATVGPKAALGSLPRLATDEAGNSLQRRQLDIVSSAQCPIKNIDGPIP